MCNASMARSVGYVAERVYRHSHDSVMREGEKGLSDYAGGAVAANT